MATSEPAFQIAEDQMGDRQKVLGHAGITLRRNRQMPIAAIGQRRIAAPGVGHHHGSGLDRRLDKAAQRSCRTIRHNFHPNTAATNGMLGCQPDKHAIVVAFEAALSPERTMLNTSVVLPKLRRRFISSSVSSSSLSRNAFLR